MSSLKSSESTSECRVAAKRPFGDDALKPAIDVLGRIADERALIGAVQAIGHSKRADLTGRICDISAATTPDSDLALACLLAFGCLGTRERQAVELAARHLGGKWHRNAVMSLLRMGTDVAYGTLQAHLISHFDWMLAVNLSRDKRTRQTSLTVIGEWCADPTNHRNENFGFILRCLEPELLPQVLTSETVRDHLREAALGMERNIWMVGSKEIAIRAVAAFDPTTAYRAARRALEDRDAHDRERYPYLLLDLDAQQAIPLLLHHVVMEESTAVRRAIGRALSSVDTGGGIDRMLGGEDARQRQAACEIAAFAPATKARMGLLTALLNSAEGEVADAALDAMVRLHDREHVEDMLERLRQENHLGRKWTLLDALAELGDTGDDGMPWPAWVKRASNHLTVEMGDQLARRLAERRRKDELDLEREARQRRR